jgi:hypothetical protein
VYPISEGRGCLGFYGFDLCVEPVTPEQIWQVLRKGGARHDHVTTGFHRLRLQVALQVREETDH